MLALVAQACVDGPRQTWAQVDSGDAFDTAIGSDIDARDTRDTGDTAEPDTLPPDTLDTLDTLDTTTAEDADTGSDSETFDPDGDASADTGPDGEVCECPDDDDPCTVAACSAGGCEQVKIPGCCEKDVDCEGIPSCLPLSCVEHVCTPGEGPVGAPSAGVCDDGDPCTVEDACDGNVCAGTPLTCTNDHGANQCVEGACAPSCDPGWKSCDDDLGNGCERSTRTLSDCGECDARCEGDNASMTCATGTCAVLSCKADYADCDDKASTGCEVHLRPPGVCSDGASLGSFPGEDKVNCGALGLTCSSTSTVVRSTTNGRGSAWYKARAVDSVSSSCSEKVIARIRLQPPPGVNYDLKVFGPCGSLRSLSNNEGDSPEEVEVTAADAGFQDDSFDYWIQISYVGVTTAQKACGMWTLYIDGRTTACP